MKTNSGPPETDEDRLCDQKKGMASTGPLTQEKINGSYDATPWLTLFTVWKARFMFPDEKASERPDISTWVTLVDVCGVTTTAPYANADDLNTSVA